MAVDMFLKVNGIEGESTQDGHAKEIDVLSWSWGCTQSGSFGTGGGGGSGKVNMHDISFTKKVDQGTNLLLQFCCNGKHIPDALLTVRKAGGKQLEYLKIKFTKCLVSSFQTGGSDGGDGVMETVSLNFSKVEFSYQKQKDDGGADGAAKTMGYDLATGKAN